MKKLFVCVAAALLLIIGHRAPTAQAGDPIGEIGVMNPTMFKCVLKDNTRIEEFQPDRFRKVTETRAIFERGGEEFDLDRMNEILNEYPNAREETCINELDVDYGFNPYDAQEFNAHLDRLESECRRENENAILVPIEETKIEGFVYEFHPEDPANPAESEWFGVPSKSVMIQAKGITFEIYWGSGEEGYYYFQNLGAGPIVINMQLPPDAHPINSDVVVFSNGLEETWTVFLGFYRGDVAPPNPSQLRTPDGNFLPFITLSDIENMSKCGSTDLPAIAQRVLPPNTVGSSDAEMPEVGGIIEEQQSAAVLPVAALLLVALAAAGFVKVKKYF